MILLMCILDTNFFLFFHYDAEKKWWSDGTMKEKKYPITEVITYDKSRDFLAIIDQLSQNNLYFLDIAIKMHHNAGLKIAEKIRQKDVIG